MMGIKITVLYIAALLVPSLIQSAHVLYEWNYLNFTWPTEAAYSDAVNSGVYIPRNIVVTGIKVWKEQVYLTIPRLKQGVPATLVKVPVNPKNGERAPLLQPYPNWEMQKLGNCSSLQYVQSMEIDTKGRMWVLENGRSEFRSDHPRTECPSRLYIFDLEDGDKLLLNYTFPDDVVRRESVFLNDIVLDHENGGWAYITDTDGKLPGIVVFSLKLNKSWKISHRTMKAQPDATTFIINGTTFQDRGNVNGIALSPASSKGKRTLYYTPFSSYEMFTIPVKVLQNPYLEFEKYVRSIGRRSSQSGGLVMSAKGDLYYGLLTKDSVSRWPISAEVFTKENQKLVFHDANVNQWPDTFAIDEVGRLWWTTNRLQRFNTDQVNITEPNFRVIFTKINDKSYQVCGCKILKFPDITA